MAEIPITWIATDTPASFPTADVDTMGPFLPFALANEAGFAFAVSPKYITNSNLVLKLKEATLGAALKHKWQVDVLLNGLDTEAFTAEVTSSASADTLSTRLITISTSGGIDSNKIAANDLIYLKLTRIDAAASEDPNPIRVYLSLIQTTTDDLDISGCAGRVGAIIDAVMSECKDVHGDVVKPANVLNWINHCQKELAQRHLWNKTTTISWTTTDGSFDLYDEIPDLEQIAEIRRAVDTLTVEYDIVSRADFEDFKARYYSQVTSWEPKACIEDNTLYVYPVPEEAGSLLVYHSYCPDDLDCTVNTAPRVPLAHDGVFKFFCLMVAAKLDHAKPDWKDLLMVAKGDYQEAANKLLGQMVHGSPSIGVGT